MVDHSEPAAVIECRHQGPIEELIAQTALRM